MPEEPKCPTCHSRISTDPNLREQGSEGTDAEGKPIPRWTDDPVLTTDGFSGPDYIGETRPNVIHITELQEDRKQIEEELSIIPATEFSVLSDHGFHLRNLHIIELRESTEKILDVAGTTLEDYFKLDKDGNDAILGPNDTVKTDWTDVERGRSYIDKAGDEKTEFTLSNAGVTPSPTFPEHTRIRAIHIEDLRRYLNIGWREFWSVAPLGTLFDMPSQYTMHIDTGVVPNPSWTDYYSHYKECTIYPYLGGGFPTGFDIHPTDGGGQYKVGDTIIYPHEIPNPKPGGPTTEPDKTWIINALTRKNDESFSRAFIGYLRSYSTINSEYDAAAGSGGDPDFHDPYHLNLLSHTIVWNGYSTVSQTTTDAAALGTVIPEQYPNVLIKKNTAKTLELQVSASMSHTSARHEDPIFVDPEIPSSTSVIPQPGTIDQPPASVAYAAVSAHHLWQSIGDDAFNYPLSLQRIIKVNKNSRLKYLLNIKGSGSATANGLNSAQTTALANLSYSCSTPPVPGIRFAPCNPYSSEYDQHSGTYYSEGSPYAITDVDGSYINRVNVNPNTACVTSFLTLKKDTSLLYVEFRYSPDFSNNIQVVTAPFSGQTYRFLKPAYSPSFGNCIYIVVYVTSSLLHSHDMDINIDDLLSAFKSVTATDGSPINFTYTSHKLEKIAENGSASIVENPDGTPLEFIKLSFYLSVNSTAIANVPLTFPVTTGNGPMMTATGPQPAPGLSNEWWETRHTPASEHYPSVEYHYPIQFIQSSWPVYSTIPEAASVIDGGSNSAKLHIDALRIEGSQGGINDL